MVARHEDSASPAQKTLPPVSRGDWLPADPTLPAPLTHTGDVRHLGRLHCKSLGNARDVWVWLPPGYDAATTRYPVVYFHDGQNVFDTATAFAGVEWQADETLTRLIAAGEIRPVIAVAIANTSKRIDEYTPVSDPRHVGGGRARDYVMFLARELKPRIDAAFRTLPWREDTALIGSSLGGLVSLYGGLVAWQAFGRIGALSPVFDWSQYDIEERYAAAPRARMPARLWIDMGTAEDSEPTAPGQVSRPVLDLRRFRSVLEQRGYALGPRLGYEEVQGAAHDEAAWAARLPRILRFLFPPRE
jgi:predicted alpha/beta superfamily hydrolase